jgi:hypothetical protein
MKKAAKSQNKKKQNKKPSNGRRAKSIKTGQSTRRDKVFVQSLNAPQLNYTNPNKFWEVQKASTPGGIKLKAKEPLGQLVLSTSSTGAFTQLFLNSTSGPGGVSLNPISFSGALFPRLSAIAQAYDMFLFRRFKLDFISSQPTTMAGQVLMWIDYDSAQTVASTSSQALSNICSVISNVYSCVSVGGGSEFSRLPRYYINQTANTINDQTTQGIGYLAVQGFTGSAGATLGELLIEYEIEFFTPSQTPIGSPTRTMLKEKEEFELYELIHSVLEDFGSADSRIKLVNCERLLALKVHPSKRYPDHSERSEVVLVRAREGTDGEPGKPGSSKEPKSTTFDYRGGSPSVNKW